VASISAQNIQPKQRPTKYSYYFSRYSHCWGWATWRRAWQHYDLYIKLWQQVKAENLLRDILVDPKAVSYWQRKLQTIYENPTGITWDYQWTFACWMQGSLSITPNVNLVSNIGVGADSTHFDSGQEFSFINVPTQAMEFPLKHPPYLVRNVEADIFTQKNVYQAKIIDVFKEELKKRWNYAKLINL
jgi:hypothetical protein